ncbi:MAG TPA: hypothetical protein VHD56_09310 [Tepidisphaeraceae bacterium]|nr:hypothetical protein [Tepidisphaeraceae bacterium]
MEPTPELIAQLHREDIEQAKRMTFPQKFLAGAELFDYAASVTMAGIRMDNPKFTPEQVLEELRRRLAMSQRHERPE